MDLDDIFSFNNVFTWYKISPWGACKLVNCLFCLLSFFACHCFRIRKDTHLVNLQAAHLLFITARSCSCRIQSVVFVLCGSYNRRNLAPLIVTHTHAALLPPTSVKPQSILCCCSRRTNHRFMPVESVKSD